MPNPESSDQTRMAERKGRLSEDMRAEILGRLKAGERASSLAREFGVTRQAVSLLKIKSSTSKSRPRLVEEEIEKLRALAVNSRPSDHGWADPGSWNDEWSSVSLHKLGEKLAKRRLMVLPIRRLFREWFGDSGRAPIGSYDPDRPESLATIPEDLRSPDFLQFLRERKAGAAKTAPKPETIESSPRPAKKRGRPGSAASMMPPPEAWEFLNPEMAGSRPGGERKLPRATPLSHPIMRTGKHRKSKGSPFTAARKKKKKR